MASEKRLTAPMILASKGGVPLVALTAHSYTMARLLDDHCDIILVGDSLGMVAHGLPNTLAVTMDMMVMHAKAVVCGVSKAFVVVDMPFGSYEASCEIAHANAVRLIKETGAQAVKLESGKDVPETIRYLTDRGIPVMGHVGLRPQAVHMDGGFKAKGKDLSQWEGVLKESRETDDAGAFCIVVEGVAEGLAQEITKLVKAPTIGIGASSQCDGQILVTEDLIGLTEWQPKFARTYMNMRETAGSAIAAFAKDVRSRQFPSADETYFVSTNKPQ